MADVSIANVVGAGRLNVELDLNSLAADLETSVCRYDPDVHPGLYVKFDKSGPMVTIYRTGRYNITGGKSVEQTEETRGQLLDVLESMGIDYSTEADTFTIKNIVCTSDIGHELDLNALAIGLGLENVEYEPEQFPGLVFRPPERDGVFLLFGSGKVVITGLTEVKDVENAAVAIREKVNFTV